MTEELKQAAQQAINALQCAKRGHCDHAMADEAIAALERALTAAQPAQATPEPVTRSRECTEPMCACMGGPCAECPEGEREKEIADLRASRDFYKRRADSLQQAQSRMRDPERTMVCDILANGALLVPAGGRYAATPEPVGEARCSTCGVTMNEPHHPACGAVTAAIIGLNTMAAQDKEARRRELAEKIRETLRGVFTHPAPGVPEIDYSALIHAAWGKHKYAQGTGGCIAFKRGAEWFRDIALAAAQAKGVDPEDLAAAGVMLTGRRSDHA